METSSNFNSFIKALQRKKLKQILLFFIAILGFLAVLFGALGSHYITTFADSSQIESYKTALLFHVFHILAVLSIFHFLISSFSKLTIFSILSWMAGICFFCGTIYFKVLFQWQFSLPLTQIGGICFLLGWVGLAFFSFSKIFPK